MSGDPYAHVRDVDLSKWFSDFERPPRPIRLPWRTGVYDHSYVKLKREPGDPATRATLVKLLKLGARRLNERIKAASNWDGTHRLMSFGEPGRANLAMQAGGRFHYVKAYAVAWMLKSLPKKEGYAVVKLEGLEVLAHGTIDSTRRHHWEVVRIDDSQLFGLPSQLLTVVL